MRDRIINIIFKAIDEVNTGLAPDERLAKSEQTVLFGKEGKLDSLGVLNFVLTAEQGMNVEFDRVMSLTEGVLADQGDGGPLTVGAFADQVAVSLDGAHHA